ncbi:MAG: Asp-tRNA(Asn)/Glu-tRNA(Gln) amidotransferase subunit GatB [Gemmatimonadota bacterium]
MSDFETVIGVEVHVQLRTETKMFCRCRAEYGAPPNAHVCPVCLGLPGALPVPNERAVTLAVRAALVLGCSVRQRSEFVRKNYFYPDLPKGYQITQFAHPLASDGAVAVHTEDGTRRVRVRRLHLEEDAGKSLHDRFEGSTAVDLNRAGVPLVEIVTEPDLRSPAEARAYLVRLKQLLEHYAAVSDCNMEEGSLRVDANLSVRRVGASRLGTKTEVKNLNSFSNVEKALLFEEARQVRLLRKDGHVLRETRLFDQAAGETRPLRGKEEAFDYRYFPDPDLPLLELDPALVVRERHSLPELPDRIELRLRERYGLSEYDAALLAATPARAAFFERAVGEAPPESAKAAANFIMGEIAAELKRRGGEAGEANLVAPEALARIVELRRDGTLSSRTAARALELLFRGEGGGDPDTVVRDHGLAQIRDEHRLEEWVAAAIRAHPREAARYRAGEERLLEHFMGAVMREARGAADPERARQMLKRRLEEGRNGA